MSATEQIKQLGYAEFINEYGKEEDLFHWHKMVQWESAFIQLAFIKAIIKRDSLNLKLISFDDFYILFSITEKL